MGSLTGRGTVAGMGWLGTDWHAVGMGCRSPSHATLSRAGQARQGQVLRITLLSLPLYHYTPYGMFYTPYVFTLLGFITYTPIPIHFSLACLMVPVCFLPLGFFLVLVSTPYWFISVVCFYPLVFLMAWGFYIGGFCVCWDIFYLSWRGCLVLYTWAGWGLVFHAFTA